MALPAANVLTQGHAGCAAQPGSSEQGTRAGQAFTALVAAVGIVSLAVAGTAVAIYKDMLMGSGFRIAHPAPAAACPGKRVSLLGQGLLCGLSACNGKAPESFAAVVVVPAGMRIHLTCLIDRSDVQNFYGLVIFWTVFVIGSAVYAYNLFNNNREVPNQPK
ncbi:hypothetical protein MMC29_000851 [Sticta canariensis]|nr:hypothetical protein [Sticta canariensis]